MSLVEVRPKTLKRGKLLTVVKPNRPSQVVAIENGINGPELAAAFRKDLLIFVARFEPLPVFNCVSYIVNDPLHDVELEPKDDYLRMPECVKQPGGERPFWSRLAFATEHVCNGPAIFLDLP